MRSLCVCSVTQAFSICINRETGPTFVLPAWHLWHLDCNCRSFTVDERPEGSASSAWNTQSICTEGLNGASPFPQIATGSNRWSKFSTCWTKRELLIIRASESQTRECFYPKSKQQFQVMNILSLLHSHSVFHFLSQFILRSRSLTCWRFHNSHEARVNSHHTSLLQGWGYIWFFFFFSFLLLPFFLYTFCLDRHFFNYHFKQQSAKIVITKTHSMYCISITSLKVNF